MSGSEDVTIRRWDTQSGAPIGEPLRGPKVLKCIAISDDGKSVVLAFYDVRILRNIFGTIALTDEPIRRNDAVKWDAASGCGSLTVLRSEDRRAHLDVNGPVLSQVNISSLEAQYSAPTDTFCLAVNLESQLVVFGPLCGNAAICRLVQ